MNSKPFRTNPQELEET